MLASALQQPFQQVLLLMTMARQSGAVSNLLAWLVLSCVVVSSARMWRLFCTVCGCQRRGVSACTLGQWFSRFQFFRKSAGSFSTFISSSTCPRHFFGNAYRRRSMTSTSSKTWVTNAVISQRRPAVLHSLVGMLVATVGQGLPRGLQMLV